MQPPLPAPTAQGSFAKTPLPHLLVYALERALSGTFELQVNGASTATMLVVQGFPAKLRTTEGVFYLGEVMVELGMITPDHLAASLQRLQESPRLQGQLLKEMGVVDDERIDAAARAQLKRKLEHLFTHPAETTYAYFDAVDLLQRYGGPPTPVDPLPVLWRGVKQSPSWEHVDATLRRVGGTAVRLTPQAQAQIGRLELTRPEMQVIDMIRQRPARVVDIANSKLVGPSIAQQLVYFLVITKQVELVEVASTVPPGASPSSAGIPAAPPTPNPNQTGRYGPASGQAFARVQLQARAVQRAPLVVEEMAASPADDERASIPGTDAPGQVALNAQAGPAGSPASPVSPLPPAPVEGAEGINALITATIASSLPPPPVGPVATPMMPGAIAGVPGAMPGGLGAMGTMPLAAPPGAPAIPPPPPSSQRAMSSPPAATSSGAIPAAMPAAPAAPAQPKVLTAEQNALKTKILERAEQITAQNYFQMLGVDKDATPEACQKAFFALAKVWHPDRLPPALVDVKDACSKVFTHLTEAHATLSDPKKRQDYMTLMKDGGATPDDQQKIMTILEAATEFQKAEILMKRNASDPQVFELVKRAVTMDPDQVDYMALYTWLEAQLPQWQSKEKTTEKIAVLDRCIQKNPSCERAYFYRAMLHKRNEDGRKAIADFKKVADMNPRNLDAAREVRLYNMRGGSKAPPPPSASNAPTATGRNKPAQQPETLGGLFGKLFKK